MNIWEKLTNIVVFLIFGAVLLGAAVWYLPVIKQNERMRAEKLELEKKIARETEISKRLDAQTKALQDPRTVERLAREKLSYAKPGEIVIRFEQPNTNASTRTP